MKFFSDHRTQGSSRSDPQTGTKGLFGHGRDHRDTHGLAVQMQETFLWLRRWRLAPTGQPRIFQNLPPRLGTGGCVYAGQLYPWKGVEILVAAMRFVPQGELHLVGGSEEGS